MKIPLYHYWKHHIIGVLLLAVASVLAILLITFNATDPSWLFYSSEQPLPTNGGGIIGAQWTVTLLYLFGASSYVLIPLLFFCGYTLIRNGSLKKQYVTLLALVIAFFLSCGLASFHAIHLAPYLVPGGIIGRGMVLYALRFMHGYIVYGIFATGCLSALVFAMKLSFIHIMSSCIRGLNILFKVLCTWVFPTLFMLFNYSRIRTRSFLRHLAHVCRHVYQLLHGHDITQSGLSMISFENGTLHAQQTEDPFWMTFLKNKPHNDHTLTIAAPLTHADALEYQATSATHHATAAPIINHEAVSAQTTSKIIAYKLPAITTLFQKTARADHAKNNSEHKALTALLEEKLARFNITGSVVAIKPGPVVTLFEYQPSIDAKVSKIMGLESDLALALEALSVRISAPIPGTSRVGFEVANKKREPVFLRDMINGKTFEQTQAHLPLILGKDTSGTDIVIDLVDMPHLLVAGSTGSGKSVALNTLLISLLCKKSPDELKLIIIDPKRLEFASYDGIPHLLFPIVTQPQKAGPIMQWLVRIMEERYELMAAKGVRGIFDYKKWCKATGNPDELPFIVVIIDELADLMMVARKEIEENIARLAQMARAAGIHLILATQRPSVDVLTGVIKVNFPSRISFRVTSKIDSRTILDAMGAETLLGKGDMLFMDAHSASLRRVHGPYVTDTEIHAVVEHTKTQSAPHYINLQEALAAQQGDTLELDDPIIVEVYAFLQTVNDISISLLQRRFKVGYNRAARLIELLETQGKILPADGAKMRKVVH